jgi:acrylyl-CoA reductase (NADPH)
MPSPRGTRRARVPASFRAIRSDRVGTLARLITMSGGDLPSDEVEIAITATALSREEALVALGLDAPAAPRPLVPGGDLAGLVLRSASRRWRRGDAVVAGGGGLGRDRDGGWAERARLPAALLLDLPPHLSDIEAMAIGTPGLAAMRAAEALEEHGVLPESGRLLVTGAGGGLGALAVVALAALGYRAAAVTRRPELAGWLAGLGAAEVLQPDALRAADARWAGAIDVLGGATLGALLAGTGRGGVVAALGEVEGDRLATSLMPFTRRGVTLLGVDMRTATPARRAAAWQRWAECGTARLGALATVLPLDAAPDAASDLLAGRLRGRVVLRVADPAAVLTRPAG